MCLRHIRCTTMALHEHGAMAAFPTRIFVRYTGPYDTPIGRVCFAHSVKTVKVSRPKRVRFRPVCRSRKVPIELRRYKIKYSQTESQNS